MYIVWYPAYSAHNVMTRAGKPGYTCIVIDRVIVAYHETTPVHNLCQLILRLFLFVSFKFEQFGARLVPLF